MNVMRKIFPLPIQEIEEYLNFMSNRLEKLSVTGSGPIALFELHMDYPTHIAYGEISFLLKKRGITPVGHKAIMDSKMLDRLIFHLNKWISIEKGLNLPFYIFRGLGMNRFSHPKFSVKRKHSVKDAVRKLTFQNDKASVLRLEYAGILVGDLFYDWHMNQRKLGTIEIGSKVFLKDLSRFLRSVNYWDSYFRSNNVYAVFVSHTCYSQGILTRMAIKHGSKSFQITADRMYQLTSEKPIADREFLEYNSSKNNQFGYHVDIRRAKDKLQKIKSGNQEIDAAHSLVSGYAGSNTQKVLESTQKVKCLIAAHCFSDAPHAYGNQLFPDYFEWFKFLLKESSSKDDSEWYLRPHPAFSTADWKIFTGLVSDYPHVKVLPLDVSIPELINQGIGAVFTSHGTVAFEAALEGALVIAASTNAGFCNFSFALIPDSIDDLSRMISEISSLVKNRSLDKNEIFHYYDLHHLRSEQSWLFKEDYRNLVKTVGGLRAQFSNPKTFEFWMKYVGTEEKINTIQSEIMRFIDSNDYFYKYIGSSKTDTF